MFTYFVFIKVNMCANFRKAETEGTHTCPVVLCTSIVYEHSPDTH